MDCVIKDWLLGPDREAASSCTMYSSLKQTGCGCRGSVTPSLGKDKLFGHLVLLLSVPEWGVHMNGT